MAGCRGRGRSVINLVRSAGRNRQGLRCDGGGGRGTGRRQGVVVGQAAIESVGDADAGDGHGVGFSHILAVEDRAGRTDGQRFGADQATQAVARHSGGIGGVIYLVGSACVKRQRLGRDVGSNRCAGIDRIIAGQTTAAATDVNQRDAADGDRVGDQRRDAANHGRGLDVRAAEGRAGRTGRDAFTRDEARKPIAADRRGRGAVIGFADDCGCQGQGLGRDGTVAAGAAGQGVVAQVGKAVG